MAPRGGRGEGKPTVLLRSDPLLERRRKRTVVEWVAERQGREYVESLFRLTRSRASWFLRPTEMLDEVGSVQHVVIDISHALEFVAFGTVQAIEAGDKKRLAILRSAQYVINKVTCRP